MRNFILYSFISIVLLAFSGCGLAGKFVQSPMLKNTHGKEDIFVEINDKSHTSDIIEIITYDNEIITASMDKSVRVWDSKTLKEKRKILGHIGIEHLGKVFAIAISPDGKYLAVGGYLELPSYVWDKDIEPFIFQIYDYQTGKLLHNLYAHVNPITDLKFSDDGKYLVSSSFDTTIRVWDVPNFKNIKSYGSTIGGGIHNIGIVKQANDNICFVDIGHQIRKYSLTNGLLKSKELPKKIAKILVFKKSKKIVVTFFGSSEVYVLNYDLELIKKFDTGMINSQLALNDNETRLAIGSGLKEHAVKIYDTTSFKQKSVFTKHRGYISAMTFVDNHTVVSSSNVDYEILLWNIKNNKILQRTQTQTKTHYDLMSKSPKTITWNDIKDKNKRKFEKEFDFENFKMQNIKSLQNFAMQAHRPPGTKRISNGKYKLGFSKHMTRLHLNTISGENVFIYQRDASTGYVHTTYGFYKNYLITGGRAGHLDILDLKGNFIATLMGHTGDMTSFTVIDGILVTSATDHMIKLWDLSKLTNHYQLLNPVATFVVAGDEWILWTEEGYFTASQNGADLIGFHVNSQKGIQEEAHWVSIDKLYDYFFRPDLVKLKLQGVDITKYTKGLTYVDVLKTPPPTVVTYPVISRDINKRKRTVRLKFKVIENDNGGVGVIRIYQEGKLVKTLGDAKINRRIANVDKKLEEERLNKLAKQRQAEYLALQKSVSKSVNGTLVSDDDLVGDVEIIAAQNKAGEYTVTLPLKAGKNTISIEAFNKTNTVASIRENIVVHAKIKKRRPKIYAIVVGVNKFEQDNVSQLKYSENDAKTIAREIKRATRLKTEVTLLRGKNVTKEKIYKAIAKIQKKAHLEDKIVFYISTHGKASRGQLYLVPHNNKKLKNWIKFEELFAKIQAIPALEQIFIIDACESGSASDIMASVYDAKASVLAKQSGVHLLMATTKGTFAFESADKNIHHGVFTNNILKALSSKSTDKNRDRTISIIELSKALQEPQYSVKQQFPVIRNVGEDTEIKRIRR